MSGKFKTLLMAFMAVVMFAVPSWGADPNPRYFLWSGDVGAGWALINGPEGNWKEYNPASNDNRPDPDAFSGDEEYWGKVFTDAKIGAGDTAVFNSADAKIDVRPNTNQAGIQSDVHVGSIDIKATAALTIVPAGSDNAFSAGNIAIADGVSLTLDGKSGTPHFYPRNVSVGQGSSFIVGEGLTAWWGWDKFQRISMASGATANITTNSVAPKFDPMRGTVKLNLKGGGDLQLPSNFIRFASDTDTGLLDLGGKSGTISADTFLGSGTLTVQNGIFRITALNSLNGADAAPTASTESGKFAVNTQVKMEFSSADIALTVNDDKGDKMQPSQMAPYICVMKAGDVSGDVSITLNGTPVDADKKFVTGGMIYIATGGSGPRPSRDWDADFNPAPGSSVVSDDTINPALIIDEPRLPINFEIRDWRDKDGSPVDPSSLTYRVLVDGKLDDNLTKAYDSSKDPQTFTLGSPYITDTTNREFTIKVEGVTADGTVLETRIYRIVVGTGEFTGTLKSSPAARDGVVSIAIGKSASLSVSFTHAGRIVPVSALSSLTWFVNGSAASDMTGDSVSFKRDIMGDYLIEVSAQYPYTPPSGKTVTLSSDIKPLTVAVRDGGGNSDSDSPEVEYLDPFNGGADIAEVDSLTTPEYTRIKIRGMMMSNVGNFSICYKGEEYRAVLNVSDQGYFPGYVLVNDLPVKVLTHVRSNPLDEQDTELWVYIKTSEIPNHQNVIIGSAGDKNSYRIRVKTTSGSKLTTKYFTPTTAETTLPFQGGNDKGGSSGCDAGFGSLAALALAAFALKRRK